MHDAAGNQTKAGEGAVLKTFAYDAENRLVSSWPSNVGYRYNGEGRRVRKVQGSATTVYVYNAQGQLIAEYTNATAVGSGGTKYLTADTLGSVRVVTMAGSGAVKVRYDYLPYGEEIGAQSGHPRYGVAEYGSGETLRQKFGAKERDTETGLDYFGARYFAGAQGRFTSPDLPFADQAEDEPQSWNLYVYVANNPLSFTDPFGLWKRLTTFDGTILYEAEKGDTLEGLADILQISVKALVGSFGSGKVQVGQHFDVTNYQNYKSDSQNSREDTQYYLDHPLATYEPIDLTGFDPALPWKSHYPGIDGMKPKSNALGPNSYMSKGSWLEVKEAARELANNILKEAKGSGVGAGARSGQHGKPYTAAAAKLRELLKQNEKGWLPEFKEVIERKIQEWTNKANTINEKIGGSGKR